MSDAVRPMCGVSLLSAVPALAAAATLGLEVLSRVSRAGLGAIEAEAVFAIPALAAASALAFIATHRFGSDKPADGSGYLALSVAVAISAVLVLEAGFALSVAGSL